MPKCNNSSRNNNDDGISLELVNGDMLKKISLGQVPRLTNDNRSYKLGSQQVTQQEWLLKLSQIWNWDINTITPRQIFKTLIKHGKNNGKAAMIVLYALVNQHTGATTATTFTAVNMEAYHVLIAYIEKRLREQVRQKTLSFAAYGMNQNIISMFDDILMERTMTEFKTRINNDLDHRTPMTAYKQIKILGSYTEDKLLAKRVHESMSDDLLRKQSQFLFTPQIKKR
jgi:hypothetical protein